MIGKYLPGKKKVMYNDSKANNFVEGECWASRTQHNYKINVVEMRILRWMRNLPRYCNIKNDYLCQKVKVADI